MRTAFALVLVVGCASPMTAVKDDNRRLSQTVTELRAERRIQERKLRDLQKQLDQQRARAVETAIPDLPVEVAAPSATPAGANAPSSARVVAIADDGSEIVYEGDAAAGKQATLVEDEPAAPPHAQPARAVRGARGGEGGSGGAAPMTPASADRLPAGPAIPLRARTARTPTRELARTSPAPAAATHRAGDADGEYRAAVELVKAGRHAEGAAALRAFLAKHPRHDFADNAQYWIGEAAYAEKDYPRALVEFRNVVENHPRGNKVPDALLKVGYCYQALGQAEKSRAVLEQVVSLYPKTEPAATAAKRLESL